MAGKSEQLQIRVTPRQKSLLRKRARAAGLDVSSYVLARALPGMSLRVASFISQLAGGARAQFALAELNELLTTCPASSFDEAVGGADLSRLSAYLQNYVAAMVEVAANKKGVEPPNWTRDVVPLEEPHFVTDLKSLRPHLVRAAPVPFKRRNIFVDATVGHRA